MGTQVGLFLFDSVTNMPILTPVFDNEEEADAFLEFVEGRTDEDIRTLLESELRELRAMFIQQRLRKRGEE